MRILMTIAEMGSGGAEAVVEELAAALVAEGSTLTVASSGGRREAALHAAGVRTAALPLAGRSPLGLWQAQRAVRALVRDDAPDLIHAHNVASTLTTHLGMRSQRERGPLVTTFHGVAESDYRTAARVLDRCSDVVVAVHDTVAGRLRKAGLRRAPLSVIPNAVRPPVLLAQSQARALLGLREQVPVALCAARLVPQKRHDLLLEAWSRVPGEAVLLLAGDGPLAAALEADIARRGLEERVRLLGERRDVPVLLSAADVFVLASDWEGLPIALLEALAAGLPVVATDVDGVGDAVGTAAGVLVPPGDPGALASALVCVLSDGDRRRAAATAARGRAAQSWSAADMLAGYQEIYADVLSVGRSRRSVTP